MPAGEGWTAGDFVFDTSAFEAGLKRIEDQLKSIDKTSDSMGKTINKSSSNFILKAGIIYAGLKGLKAMLNQMPEIGQALGIAKEIFFKNLLFPLRKKVFPYLQKLLDIVRNNRTQFVKWGQVIVNVFDITVNAVKNAVNFVKNLVTYFKNFFETIFRQPTIDIEKLFNLLTFKVAVLTTFLTSLLERIFTKIEPLLDVLAVTIRGIIDLMKEFSLSFFESFTEALETLGIMDEINLIFDEFKKILEFLNPLIEKLTPGVKLLGEALGKYLATKIKLVLLPIRLLLQALNSIAELSTGKITFEELFAKGKTGFKDLIDEMGKTFLNWENIPKVDDAIIKPDGTIIRTHPSDTIIATKGNINQLEPDGENINKSIEKPSKLNPFVVNQLNKTEKESSKFTFNIDFSGMQFILQDGSREDIEKVGSNIVDIIRRKVSQELEFLGAV